jgi:aryl carrier-like protein
VAGKIDRGALPLPQIEGDAPVYCPPETPTEVALAAIWMDVLHLERVGRNDDFFSLGADSIQLFKITARAHQSGLPLKAKDLLRRPSVRALAAYLDEISAQSHHGTVEAAASVALLRRNGASPQAEESRCVERAAW